MKKQIVKNFLNLYTEAMQAIAEEGVNPWLSTGKYIVDPDTYDQYDIAFSDETYVCAVIDGKITWFIQADDDDSKHVKYVPIGEVPDQITGDLRLAGVDSLEGCPKTIVGNFECVNSPGLDSLANGPAVVGGYYNCCQNENLASLEGVAVKIGGDFNCNNCDKLTSFKGLEKTKIGGDLICSYTASLKNPEGLPPPENIGGGKVGRGKRISKGRILCDGKLANILNAMKDGFDANPPRSEKEQVLLKNLNGWLEKLESRSDKLPQKPEDK